MRIASWTILAALTIVPIGVQSSLSQIPQSGNMGRPGSAPAPVSLAQPPVPSIFAVVSAVMPNFTERGPVKGMPFAATETVAHEQTLADGTTIKSTAEVLLWRDAEGRKRGESTIKSNSDAVPQLNFVSVWDPVAGTVMTWSGNQDTGVVIVVHFPDLKLNGSRAALDIPPPPPPQRPGVAPHPQPATFGLAHLPSFINRNAANIHTETLPPDNIAGLYVEGTRTTQVIPAGTQGNDREITLISETWTSPELKITVRQMTNDPRTGKVTTEFTSIDRSDPDPALFKAPEGYKVMDIVLPAPAASSTQR
jgi:hypothetical protein